MPVIGHVEIALGQWRLLTGEKPHFRFVGAESALICAKKVRQPASELPPWRGAPSPMRVGGVALTLEPLAEGSQPASLAQPGVARHRTDLLRSTRDTRRHR